MKNNERLKIAERELHRNGISSDSCEILVNGGVKIIASESIRNKFTSEIMDFFDECEIKVEFK